MITKFLLCANDRAIVCLDEKFDAENLKVSLQHAESFLKKKGKRRTVIWNVSPVLYPGQRCESKHINLDLEYEVYERCVEKVYPDWAHLLRG